MPIINGLGWTFDTVSSAYEKMRPGYAEALYERIFRYHPLGEESHAVEIGCGGGQATAPILNTGCHLTGVECGERFCARLREKFADAPQFSVICAKFEDTEFEENSVDFVFSASAFHWIPEEIGYQKVYSMLKSGGAFARFANHPFRDKGNPALSRDIDAMYDQYYYPYHKKEKTPLTECTEEDARARAMIAEQYGFGDIQYALFYRERVFSADEYIALLGTYSDHIAIEERIRTEFFDGIHRAINRHGGMITIYDTMDLQLARKP